MIITKIQGGLGNQLFQWAHGKSLAAKHNDNLYYDLSFYNSSNGATPRQFLLHQFPGIQPIENKTLAGFNGKVIRDNFQYQELVGPNSDRFSHYLDGYWQSEKYFTNIQEIIRHELQPTEEIKKLGRESFFTQQMTVSLHVRRTDYLTSNGYHPVQSLDYYQQAVDLIGPYDHLLIFSDDISWCRDNFNFKNMILMSEGTVIEDLWFMSMCQHNIIANSTFSWWGAWLNTNPQKKVIAPTNWFGPQANLNTQDLLPEAWIKI